MMTCSSGDKKFRSAFPWYSLVYPRGRIRRAGSVMQEFGRGMFFREYSPVLTGIRARIKLIYPQREYPICSEVDGITAERKNVWGKKDELLNRSDELALKADLLAFERKYTEAVEYYSRALEVNPQNPHLWAFKGITLNGGLHRDEEARACWENAKKLDPDLEKAFSYTERNEPVGDLPAGKPTCGMSETTRQKILKRMREQAERESF